MDADSGRVNSYSPFPNSMDPPKAGENVVLDTLDTILTWFVELS
jgi:hypothetical protein